MRLAVGMPWTTSLLTEVQSTAGKPWYPLNADLAPSSSIFASAALLQVHRGCAATTSGASLMHLAQHLAGAAHLLDLGGGLDHDCHGQSGSTASCRSTELREVAQRRFESRRVTRLRRAGSPSTSAKRPERAVVLDHRRGLLVEGLHALCEDLFGVVGALLQSCVPSTSQMPATCRRVACRRCRCACRPDRCGVR